MTLIIKTTVSSLADVKQSLRQDVRKIRTQMAAAVNETAKHGRSVISRLIRQHVPISKKFVDKQIIITKANESNLTAKIETTDTGSLPLKFYKAKAGRDGVKVKFDKKGGFASTAMTDSGQQVPLSTAFIVASIRGNIFARKSDKRLPIAKLFGPGILDSFEKSGGESVLAADLNAYLKKRLDYRLGQGFGGHR